MGTRTGIEWAHHTFNPWWGCVKVSEACRHCYAEGIARRFGDDHWGPGSRRRFFGDEHWEKPYQWDRAAERRGTRRRVFCASMADVFELLPPGHPDAFAINDARRRLRQVIHDTPKLDWMLLTKRPENALEAVFGHEWFRARRNVWLGVTVEDRRTATERLPYLVTVPAAVRFVSCEPLLEHVELTRVESRYAPFGHFDALRAGAWSERYGFVNHSNTYPLDWVIAGGESGAGARPTSPQWMRSLRAQCAQADVPFFFKQWGTYLPRGQGRARRSPFHAAIPNDDMSFELFHRVGKRRAGRRLDGREHDAFPKQTKIAA